MPRFQIFIFICLNYRECSESRNKCNIYNMAKVFGPKFIQVIGLAKRSFNDGTFFVVSCTVYCISCNFFRS